VPPTYNNKLAEIIYYNLFFCELRGPSLTINQVYNETIRQAMPHWTHTIHNRILLVTQNMVSTTHGQALRIGKAPRWVRPSRTEEGNYKRAEPTRCVNEGAAHVDIAANPTRCGGFNELGEHALPWSWH